MTIVNWALTVMRNNCFFHNEGAANFPHTQPMAANGWSVEEPERWDRTSDFKGALLQPLHSMFDLTSPTQINDGTIQIDHDTGAYYVSYSFRTISRVLFQLM